MVALANICFASYILQKNEWVWKIKFLRINVSVLVKCDFSWQDIYTIHLQWSMTKTRQVRRLILFRSEYLRGVVLPQTFIGRGNLQWRLFCKQGKSQSVIGTNIFLSSWLVSRRQIVLILAENQETKNGKLVRQKAGLGKEEEYVSGLVTTFTQSTIIESLVLFFFFF